MTAANKTEYKYRFLARFIIEAKTPLSIGTGEKDMTTDALIARDVNGMPYIPGTSLAGVVRNMIDAIERERDPESFIKKDDADKYSSFFGFQGRNDSGKGSQIIFSEAKIISSKGEIIDGIQIKAAEDSLLKHYKELPIRQHVKISERGVADNKFDEQVVFAGTRFCFEIEMVSKEADRENFVSVMQQIGSKTFRIGGGTRSGFGEIKVIDSKFATLDLTKQLPLYLDKSSNLAKSREWNGWETDNNGNNESEGYHPLGKVQSWIEKEIDLTPRDFFIFGSGFGDDNVDATPVRERKVEWNQDGNGKEEGSLVDHIQLIPATSIKGALSHRVAYHYNKIVGNTAEKLKADIDAINVQYENRIVTAAERLVRIAKVKEKYTGKNNEAVVQLFGSEGDFVDGKMRNQYRGNVIISDIYEQNNSEHIFNHISIDRFTGGGIESALYSERASYGNNKTYCLKLYINEQSLSQDVKSALENTLDDLKKGLLPLGGNVNRGHGVFIESKNNK